MARRVGRKLLDLLGFDETRKCACGVVAEYTAPDGKPLCARHARILAESILNTTGQLRGLKQRADAKAKKRAARRKKRKATKR